MTDRNRTQSHKSSKGSTGTRSRSGSPGSSRTRRSSSQSRQKSKTPLTEEERRQRQARRRKAALQKEKREVRHHVVFTGVLMAAVFGAMSVYLLVFANAQAEELFENDYNRRQEILLSQNIRGKIYSADGEVLAETVFDEEGNSERVYPYSNLFSHIVGYTYKGGSGIEQLEDYQLSQSDISLSEKAYYDEVNEKYPANAVYTTLDYDLQLAAYEALGDNDGAVIVTDVNTGDILAMVSKPDFDPNTIEEDWDEISEDADSATLVNRATQGMYAPGSTFKIFDVIELLTEDITNADTFSFYCEGYTTIEETMINCYHWTTHGQLTLADAFAESCNSAFVTIGYSLDRDLFNETLSNLMFGEELPYDLPSGTSSYVLDDATETEDVLQLAIGQGETLMTPLHLNMITAAIANGGTVYKNQIVGSVTTGTGTVLSETEPEAYRTVMSEEIASYIREYMRQAALTGTAEKMANATYNPAGKTGSAEYLDGETSSHAWFTGFAPYEDPEVAITVILEGAGSGGTAAVPVALEVLDAYFGVETEVSTTVYASSSSSDEDSDEDSSSDTTVTTVTEDYDPSEGTTVTLNVDTNGDGINDAIDTNGDGIPEAFDTDGDGIPETSYEAAMAAAAAQEAAAESVLESVESADTAGTAEEDTAVDASSAEATADTATDVYTDTDTDTAVDTTTSTATDTTADTTVTDETTDVSTDVVY